MLSYEKNWNYCPHTTDLLLVSCGQQTKEESTKTTISKMPKIEGFTYYGKIPENPKK